MTIQKCTGVIAVVVSAALAMGTWTWTKPQTPTPASSKHNRPDPRRQDMTTETVVERDVPIETFNQLEVAGAFKVYLRIGEPSVVLRVDSDAMDDVDAVLMGSTLRIGPKPGHNVEASTLEADVRIPSLEGIVVSGASTLRILDAIEGSQLTVKVSGASKVTGTLKVSTLTSDVSGASESNLTGAADTLSCTVSGASRADLSGLQATTADVTLSGASRMSVNASEGLKIKASGASRLLYSGGAKVSDQQVSGASSVSQR